MDRKNYQGTALEAQKKRTRVSTLMIFLAMPITVILSYFIFDGAKYMITSLLMVTYTLVPFFMVFENRKPKAREIVLIAMMTAITVCAHIFFHVTVPFQIGTALIVISGVSLGPEAGFLIGALFRFFTNFYMGQGPWTPWQMFCYGILGFLAGLTFNKVTAGNRVETMEQTGEVKKQLIGERKSRSFQMVMGPVICVLACMAVCYLTFLIVPGKDQTFFGWRIYAAGAAGLIIGAVLQRKRLPADNITLTVFTFLSTLIIYGGVMNLAAMFTASGVPGTDISLNSLRILFISGLPYDMMHAVEAAICVFVLGNPMIEKLERIKIKYGIYR